MRSVPNSLPAGLELDRILATSARSTVLQVHRGSASFVLRLVENDAFLATEVLPFAALDEPGLVAPYEWGHTQSGQPYVLRPFVDGRPCDEALSAAPAEQVVPVVRSLLTTLAALHERGFVHRDIKASNVLVQGTRAYLIDFELAVSHRATETIAGTPFHVAPEVLVGQSHRPTADLFSVGAMLAYAFGSPPPQSFTVRFPTEDFWHASGIDASSIPEPLRALVRALVRRHPADRPESARHALALLPDSGGALEARLTLPFLAGRNEALDAAVQGAEAGLPLVLVGVADPDELEPVADELRLRLALTAGRAAVVEVLHATAFDSIVERRLRDVRFDEGLDPLIVLPSDVAQRALSALEDEWDDDLETRAALVQFPRVPAAALAAHLARLSDGASPRAARSLAHSLVEQCNGRLSWINDRLARAEEDGVLRRIGAGVALLLEDWPLGPDPEHALGHEFEALPAPARDVLRAIAALGLRQASLAAIAQVTELDLEPCARTVDELRQAKILDAGLGPGGTLLVTDPRWLRVASLGLNKTGRRRLHKRCLRVLSDRGADPAELEQQRLEASSTTKEFEVVLDHAEALRSRGQLGVARALAQGVAERASRFPTTASRAVVLQARLELAQGDSATATTLLASHFGAELGTATIPGLLVGAEAAELSGRRLEARGFYERVIDQDPADRGERLRALTGAGYGMWLDGNPRAALDRIDGVPRADDPPEHAGAMLNLRAGALADLGRFDEAQAALDEALGHCERGDDATLLGRTELNRVYVARRAGEADVATAALERAVDSFEQAGHVKLLALAVNNLGVLARDKGLPRQAGQLFERSLSLRRRLGDAHGLASTMANLGFAALDAGELSGALSWLDRARARMSESQYPAELGMVDVQRAIALAWKGERELARQALASPSLDSIRRAKPLMIARAEALIDLNDKGAERARRRLQRALADAGTGDPPETFRTACWLVALDRTDPEARAILEEAAGGLNSEVRILECNWLLDDEQTDAASVNALGAFERAGRTDLVHVVALHLAHWFDGVGRPEDRRRAMSRATRATDALVEGLPEHQRETVLARTAFLAGARRRSPGRAAAVGIEWFQAWNHSMAGDRDLDQLLLATVDKAIEVTAAESGFLVLINGTEVQAQVFRGRHEEMSTGEARFSRTVVREAIRSGSATVTADATRDARFANAESVHELEPRSILCVPLTAVDDLGGAIYLSKPNTGSGFDEFDSLAVRTLADQASIALTTLRRHSEVERLNRRLSEQVDFRNVELGRMRSLLRQRNTVPPVGNLVGESPAMETMLDQLARLAPSDLPVLLYGQRGSEMARVARAIHEHSSRAAGPLLSLNLATLPLDLVQEELFGRAKRPSEMGRARLGAWVKADRGTLFLDSIEVLAPEAQSALLAAVEEGRVRPVGARKRRKADVRLVTGANLQELDRRLAEGTFDRELYDLVRCLDIAIPSLAERVDDIPLLVRQALDHLNEKNGTAKTMTAKVVSELTRRTWPGELRELTNEVSRLFYLCDRTIDRPDLIRVDEPGRSIDAMPASYRLEDVERAAIARALEATSHNKERTAKLLGISRAGLYKKLARLGL